MDDARAAPAADRWVAAHPVLLDVLIALVLLVLSTIQLASAFAFERAPLAVVAELVSIAVAVPLRRVSPEGAFGVTVVGAAIAVGAGVPGLPVGLLLVGAVAVRRDTPRAAVCGALGVAVLGVVAWAARGSVGAAALPAFVVVVGLLAGAAAGTRRRYVAALVELAENLRLERDQRAELAVAAERARIARDMHDVVAHGLSVMIRLADGTQSVAESDPVRAGAAAGQIAEVGRSSLADMRRVLGVLREDAATPATSGPQPTLADVSALVALHREAGVPVVVRRLDTDGVAPGAANVAYRIVQETLTNASRYAEDATVVALTVHRSGDDLRIEVEDDGRTGTSAAPSRGSERGLVGVRERAALYDGEVEAGPRMPNGWLVTVTLRGVGAP